jgi:hypothetical protein
MATLPRLPAARRRIESDAQFILTRSRARCLVRNRERGSTRPLGQLNESANRERYLAQGECETSRLPFRLSRLTATTPIKDAHGQRTAKRRNCGNDPRSRSRTHMGERGSDFSRSFSGPGVANFAAGYFCPETENSPSRHRRRRVRPTIGEHVPARRRCRGNDASSARVVIATSAAPPARLGGHR